MPYGRTDDRVRIYYVLSPATHFANRDQPDAWNRAVLEFLARCDGRRKGAA